MNLHEYAVKFYTSKQSAGRSIRTLENYHFHIDLFLDWCDAQGYSDGDLWGVTGAEVIEEYQAIKRKAGWKPHSITGTFRSLRALYHWSSKRFSEAQGDPFDYLTMPKTPDLLPKAISYNQYLVLLHGIERTPGRKGWLSQRDRLLIRLLFECGPRANELLSMKVGDVDLDQRRLRLMRWKIHKEDFIPCSRSLRDELATWLEQRPACDHDSLWPSYLSTDKYADNHVSGVAKLCNVAESTVRNWCKYYQAFLSPGAAAPTMQREFTGRDLAVFEHIAVLYAKGASKTKIIKSLKKISFSDSYPDASQGAGEPLPYDGLKEMLRRRCKNARLPIFLPHAFRHGCGVHIVTRGGDISLVQKILGHQQLSTTEVYLRFNGDQLRSLYDRIFD